MAKTAVLTIDDGPSPLTGEFVEFLGRKVIPAVMFFRGDHDDPHPRLGGSLVRGDSGEVILLHDHPHTDAFRPGYFRDLVQGTADRGVSFVAPQVSTTLPRL